MSIVDLIKDQLSGDLLGRLSSVIGESEEKTKAAAGAAVPSLLSVLANSVLSGRGLDGLLEALRRYDGTDPAATLRSPDAEAAGPDEGADVLGSILGPNLSTLINLLSKFSHVAGPAMKSLLSYLGPIILSAIAAQLKGKGGLTPANLTSFFTAEKANISKAMPAGLSLVDLPSIPGVPTTVPKATAGGPPAWLLPALAVGLIGLAAWFFLKSPSEPEAPADVPAAPVAASDPMKNIPPPPIDGPIAIPSADEVTKGLSDVYAGATQALADVKDVASAEAAAPKLGDLGTKVDVLKALWDKLPAEAKALVAKVTAEHLGTLKDVVAKVLEIPGVGEKLKPILDVLLEKLAGFAS